MHLKNVSENYDYINDFFSLPFGCHNFQHIIIYFILFVSHLSINSVKLMCAVKFIVICISIYCTVQKQIQRDTHEIEWNLFKVIHSKKDDKSDKLERYCISRSHMNSHRKLRNISSSTLNREQSVVIENVTILRNACMI